jgi:hypothetical protein
VANCGCLLRPSYLNIDDWGECVRSDTIEALSFLNDTLNEAIDQHSDLQVSTVSCCRGRAL